MTDEERIRELTAALQAIRHRATHVPAGHYYASWTRQQWAADIVDEVLGKAADDELVRTKVK